MLQKGSGFSSYALWTTTFNLFAGSNFGVHYGSQQLTNMAEDRPLRLLPYRNLARGNDACTISMKSMSTLILPK